MEFLKPIRVERLMEELDRRLLDLLNDLAPFDWQRPTVAGQWRVHDVAAHLLDGNLRRLAIQRDQHFPPASNLDLSDYRGLVDFLNRLNREWIVAARRLSPALMVWLLQLTGREVRRFHDQLDPLAPAPFPVAWAGESVSPNWFDWAREYTERWHHQQQIREAVERPLLESRRFLFPVLNTFMRALPHHYDHLKRPPGTRIQVLLQGPAGGSWSLRRGRRQWELEEPGTAADTVAGLPQGVAWRLFSKGLELEKARPSLNWRGDRQLAEWLLHLVAVMAYRESG